MPEIRGLPEIKDYPGANPLRIKTLKVLRAMASDPTSLEVMPLGGMTRALKGTKGYHGFRTPNPSSTRNLWREAGYEAELILKSRYGERWPLDAPKDAYVDLAEHLVKEKEKNFRKSYMFDKFEPAKAGSGAGGNLYGEGIYIAGHQKISKGYGNTIRKQNIPPQARILDTETILTHKEMDRMIEAKESTFLNSNPSDVKYFQEKAKKEFPNGARIVDIEPLTLTYHKWIKKAGYDGISYPAGKVMGLPEGVPEGTRNYVIYNYDIINNPRKIAIERGFKKAK